MSQLHKQNRSNMPASDMEQCHRGRPTPISLRPQVHSALCSPCYQLQAQFESSTQFDRSVKEWSDVVLSGSLPGLHKS